MLFFGGLALWHGWAHGEPRTALVLGVLAVTVGGAGIIWPAALRPVFVGWLALAFPIGWLVSRLLLLFLFAGLITPVALAFRAAGRDVLQRRRQRGQSSYWMRKPPPAGVKSYLRQF